MHTRSAHNVSWYAVLHLCWWYTYCRYNGNFENNSTHSTECVLIQRALNVHTDLVHVLVSINTSVAATIAWGFTGDLMHTSPSKPYIYKHRACILSRRYSGTRRLREKLYEAPPGPSFSRPTMPAKVSLATCSLFNYNGSCVQLDSGQPSTA